MNTPIHNSSHRTDVYQQVVSTLNSAAENPHLVLITDKLSPAGIRTIFDTLGKKATEPEIRSALDSKTFSTTGKSKEAKKLNRLIENYAAKKLVESRSSSPLSRAETPVGKAAASSSTKKKSLGGLHLKNLGLSSGKHAAAAHGTDISTGTDLASNREFKAKMKEQRKKLRDG